jgi:hypothetical protein
LDSFFIEIGERPNSSGAVSNTISAMTCFVQELVKLYRFRTLEVTSLIIIGSKDDSLPVRNLFKMVTGYLKGFFVIGGFDPVLCKV